ncbi:MAG: hypothetical protein WC528_03400 [Patescibacteria group bacterium]
MITINIKDKTDDISILLVVSKYSQQVVKIYTNRKKKKTLNYRLFRAGVLGDILYKLGGKNVKNNEAENQVVAALTEYFIFNLRIIHDILLEVIGLSLNKKLPKSYNDLLKKIKSDDKSFPEIKGDLRKHIIRYSAGFEELRRIRNSIKEDEILNILVKNNIYYVNVKGFGNTKNVRILYEKKLSEMIFNYTSFLFILMLIISQDTKSI